MRFRVSILRSLAFRSLAPLLGLSALMTAMAAGTDQSSGPQPDARTLARLFRSVVDFVAPAAELGAAHHASTRPSPRAVLAFSALAATPLCRSLWMVASSAPVPPYARRPQLQPLRC
ncbi:MAG TPA: hypothetical protein VN841_14790 [Bryobacteraceae bacterium]|nr:hypothetical protein [Bryobacteraceae bacterium]